MDENSKPTDPNSVDTYIKASLLVIVVLSVGVMIWAWFAAIRS